MHRSRLDQISFSMWMLFFISLIPVSLSSNIICNGIGICENDKLICNPNEECYILCNGTESCRESNILCPSAGNDCIIDVNGTMALFKGSINSSLMNGGNLMIDAIGVEGMYGINIDCPSNGYCNITSHPDDNSILSSASIKAHSSTRLLFISVKDSYSLRYANILCPNPTANINKNCIVDAPGLEALKIVSVYGSTNLLLTCTSSECWYDEYPTLSCTPYFNSICEMRATGGIFDCVDTNATCYGNNSAVLGYEMVDDFILCFGTYSCGHHSYHQAHVCSNKRNCYIYCGGLYSCMYASFQCPLDYDCIVTANGRYSMYTADIVNATSSKGNLLINGYGDGALDRVTIGCPKHGGDCVINVSGGGYHMISDLKIYGLQSASDLNLTCKYTTTVASGCYYTPPQMYCDLDQSFCTLNLIAGYHGFECIDNTSLCYGTRSPTVNPTTSSPTSATLNPTTSAPTSPNGCSSTLTFSMHMLFFSLFCVLFC